MPKSTHSGTSEGGISLSSDALSKLTQKIAAGVESSRSKPTKTNGAQTSKAAKHKPASKSNEMSTVRPETAKPVSNWTSNAANTGPKIPTNSRFTGKPQDDGARGKKRERSGNVKTDKKQEWKSQKQSRQQVVLTGTNMMPLPPRGSFSKAQAAAKAAPPPPVKTSTAKPTKTPGEPKKQSKKDILLQEIISLGGTEEDLALVGDLDTDSDEEETIVPEEAGQGKTASKSEIERFMKELGLDGAETAKAAVIEDDEATEEEDEEEEESGSEEGSEEDEDASSEEDVAPPLVNTSAANGLSLKKSIHLVVEPRPDWHAHPLKILPEGKDSPMPAQFAALQEKAKTLLATENTSYTNHNLSKSANRQFLSQIMTSGTLSDKISALTLVCQESPLHTMKTLESLLNLAKKKSRSQAIAALNAIKDLFATGVVLPADRKLKTFSKQNLGGLVALQKKGRYDKEVQEILIVWAFEDWLKSYFFEVLKVLEVVAGDGGVTWTRTMAVNMVFEMLKEKPEGESNLLRLLVNKLGDSDRKVLSKTSYLLLQLMTSHPAMKSIIIEAIESEVLFRSGNNQHAKYYSVITLNQTILSKSEPEVANQLLKTYFAVLAGLLKKKEPTVSKPGKDGKLGKRAKKRLQDEEHALQVEEETNSRLVSAVLTGVNRAFPFSDLDDEVFQKHMDTIFRITHSANFNTSVQALMLIFQVANSKQMVSDRFYRTLYDSLLDPRLSGSSKQAMYLNLLFRALKTDPQIKRVKAFIKRIVQTATMHNTPYICGIIYLLSELETNTPSLRSIFESHNEEDNDEEVFVDAADEDDEKEPARVQLLKKIEKDAEAQKKRADNAYDGRKRDPLYSNADRSCLWELLPFLTHFHPTVALFASHLLSHTPMPSKPDLSMHTLTHFLDRFVYRNAKSSARASTLSARGSSIMQPLAGSTGEASGMVLNIKSTGRSQAPVNTENFWKRKVEDVSVDEVFFHKYFNAKKPTKTKSKKERKGELDGEVDDSEGGNEAESLGDEDEIWDALVKSQPELDGADGFDDDDVDMDDFEGMPGDDDDHEESDEGLDSKPEGEDAWSDMDGSLEAGSDDEVTTDALVEGEDDFSDDNVIFDDSDAGLDSDDEIPSDIDEQLATIGKQGKSVEDEKDDRKSKRRKLKNLPVFASADDYASLMAGEDDDEDM